MTHIYVNKLTIMGSDNGLSPGRRQAIIWTNAGILSIGPLGINFSKKIYQNYNIFIQPNAFKSFVCELAAILSRPQCVKLHIKAESHPLVGITYDCNVFCFDSCLDVRPLPANSVEYLDKVGRKLIRPYGMWLKVQSVITEHIWHIWRIKFWSPSSELLPGDCHRIH